MAGRLVVAGQILIGSMSHLIHDTEGIILDSGEYGESGKSLSVLTPNYGILRLYAMGVREQKSKMRGSLTVGSVGTFEFVEGREVKRLTGVFVNKRFENIFTNKSTRNVYNNIVIFLKRVLLGESEHQNLYTTFLTGLDFMEEKILTNKRDSGIVDNFDFEVVEVIVIISILSELGYWEKTEINNFEENNLSYVLENKSELIERINKSIKSTHL